jgi:phage-related protein
LRHLDPELADTEAGRIQGTFAFAFTVCFDMRWQICHHGLMVGRDTRPISWVKAARKEFEEFPERVRLEIERALTYAAEGRKADVAKPMKGLGSGVYEIALRFRSDAYRAVYAVQLDADIWVVHAFQKKSKTGIRTPKQEVDLIRERIKRLEEVLK